MTKAFTPVRFYVEWHPAKIIEAECVSRGMKPDDGTSFWDWVEVYDHVQTKTFPDFTTAVAFALSIASQDCFGGARLYRQQQHVKKLGKRSTICWDDECYWDGLSGDDCPDINKPDQYCVD
jgi:hypothetical protein